MIEYRELETSPSGLPQGGEPPEEIGWGRREPCAVNLTDSSRETLAMWWHTSYKLAPLWC
jgi:hypothetical protein